jgi:uncharacterized membrane protein
MDILHLISRLIALGVLVGLVWLAYKQRDKLGIFSEFFQFMKVRKKWWLAPILLLLVMLSVLIVLTEGSALAPFIYTLF